MTSPSSFNRARATYSPSAPPVPDQDEPKLAHPYNPSRAHPSQDYYSSSSFSYTGQNHTPAQNYGYNGGSSFGSGQNPYSYGYSYPPYNHQQQYQGYNIYDSFPPGTHPDVIRSFQVVDRDRSGFIEEKELQEALSTGYQRFNIRTIRLLVFLFKNPSDPALRVGEFSFLEYIHFISLHLVLIHGNYRITPFCIWVWEESFRSCTQIW
ncbi:hypothetical protein M9H77_16580 [Catharanthus roseus]|uniref:Uncharacterized protein n=1 Tax=Catharanthus roseus TaxID=4058 RepID=A0ACC0B2C1_CATRO|nr:hypothetical protein M9H77_16580 [Catharanthus roseus]